MVYEMEQNGRLWMRIWLLQFKRDKETTPHKHNVCAVLCYQIRFAACWAIIFGLYEETCLCGIYDDGRIRAFLTDFAHKND